MAKHDPWSFAVIDAYEPIPYHKGWKKCKKCKQIPRLWIFNNGAHAKCLCGDKYLGTGVRAESIMSYVTRNNGSLKGHVDTQEMLRIKWNVWVETGTPQDKLPEGMW